MLILRGKTVDTLGFARRLEASGVHREYAEAFAVVLLKALEDRRLAVCYDTRGRVGSGRSSTSACARVGRSAAPGDGRMRESGIALRRLLTSSCDCCPCPE
jgi:hypothetical protein